MTASIAPQEVRAPARAWRMLILGVLAQAAGTVFVSTPAFLIPVLHLQQGLPLAQAGLLAGAPTFGMVLTLIAWGAAADRYGERAVIVAGLLGATVCAAAATVTSSFTALAVLLIAGGAAAASVNAASGRVVVGWFPKQQRGLAMGVRQMSQPLGVSVAAVVVPALAHTSTSAAFAFSAVFVGVLAVACRLGIIDPPRPTTTAAPGGHGGNPYRRDGFLWRIHTVSVLLVLPQFTLATFGLIWMIGALRLPAAAAGVVVAAAQFTGAVGRIGVGVWSDRVGSRVRPLRWIAAAAAMGMLLVAGSTALGWTIAAIAAYVLASVASVADNGLAFTAVAEAAGPRWSGRALGAQNTGQFAAASAVAPGIGALITLAGYPTAYVLVGVAATAALAALPRHDHHAA